MTPTVPTPNQIPIGPPAPRRPPARSMTPARVAAAVSAVLTTLVLLLAGPARAQTDTTLAPIAPVAPPTTVPVDNPGSFTAGVLFFVICAVIIVGALILYVRNRAPRPSPTD